MPRVQIDGASFRDFQRTLQKMAPDTRKGLNRELRQVLEGDVLPDARRNAGWSSRIPSAIRPQVTTTRLALRVSAKDAPHAYPFEGISRGGRAGFFRHPVFGNRNVWVSQNTRPFLQPAFDKNREQAVRAAEQAVDKAARAAGFK